MLSEADFNPGNKVEIDSEDNIAVCSEICEALIADLKNDDVLRVDTKSITKCESFSTKATVSFFSLRDRGGGRVASIAKVLGIIEIATSNHLTSNSTMVLGDKAICL